MDFVEYPDQDIMMIDLANKLAGELENVLFHEDCATLVVPGGATPGPIYDSLCAADLDWSRVRVMLSDERCVPETSPRSNAAMVKERLLTGRAAAAEWVAICDGADGSPDRRKELEAAVTGCLPVAVMVLGMGSDMHTASLFPGAEGLAGAMDAHAPPLASISPPGSTEARVTLTAPVLKNALARHIVITGADKRAALDVARHSHDPLTAPISAFLAGSTVHWAE